MRSDSSALNSSVALVVGSSPYFGMASDDPSKKLYRELRALPWHRIWTDRVARFDRATPRERLDGVAWIRAVGVVFSESGLPSDKEDVRRWLLQLLKDPEEKVRRYAMAALPKVGVDAHAEQELLALTRIATSKREETYVAKALGKVGGLAAAQAIATSNRFDVQSVQQANATLARLQQRSRIPLDRVLSDVQGVLLHLRSRRGLEGILADEVKEQGRFSVVDVRPGCVAVRSTGGFSLRDVFALRCFGSVGFVLDRVSASSDEASKEKIAAAIASPRALQIFGAFTEGAFRYRLDFVEKGHQRGAVRSIAARAYALCPQILNDPREAPWAIDIHSTPDGESVELRPRLSPDPRFSYRLDDIPAASHPPLAACMARVGGKKENEMVWDPFCGSGLELIERARLGGVRKIFGTDLSAEAIDIAEKNLKAAQLPSVDSSFSHCDFRDFARLRKLNPGSLTLIITNPPLGRRVPIPNLRGLFNDLFATAATLLQPGGRLVLTNPFPVENGHRLLKRELRHLVDMGGFDCHLEVYRKAKAKG